MFKKLLLIAIILLLPQMAFAGDYDDKVSGGTVTIGPGENSWGMITFNSVVNHLLLINNSTNDTIYCTFNEDVGWASDNTVFTVPTILSGSTVEIASSSSISLDFNAYKVGLYVKKDAATASVTYVGTFAD